MGTDNIHYIHPFSSELFLSSNTFSMAPQRRIVFITDDLQQFLYKAVQWNHKVTFKKT